MKLLTAAVLAALSTYAVGASAATVVPNPGLKNANPERSSYNHAWRHGVVENINTLKRIKAWDASHASTQATNSKTLSYGGGTGGVGVLNSQSKVYLVFYGTQWGTSSTDANGNLKFTNDTAGAAGAAQQMFKGIGTNNETWSNELTQWCDTTSGATSCAAGITRIPRQQNILKGVWYDNSKASPATASAAQLANEAIAAAAHFGNTTASSNLYAYYVILSPKGTNPDSYQGQYCAYHDYTADAGVSSPYGEMAWSNQPYNIDSGAGCGVGFINSPGTLDGFTMTLGHEWHEMMSDQFPAGGWSNHNSGTYAGQENSDECAWIAAGQTGGAAMIAFSTGTFAEQASYSNDTASCAISHADVSGSTGGNNPPTANFSYTTSGLTANFTDSSTDTDGTIASHAWTFGDGGTSTAANPSYTYAAAGTYSVTETVTDNGGATGSKTSSLALPASGGNQLLANTGFESTASWTATSGVICATGCSGGSAYAGHGFAWLDGYGSAHTDTLAQTVAVPSGHTSATLKYFLHVTSDETTTTAKNDTLTVALYSGSTLIRKLGTYSNLNKNSAYVSHTNALTSSDLSNPNLTVQFTGTENSTLQTSFFLDNVTLTVK